MAQHIFRVVVRGMFADLSAERREQLLTELPEHEIHLSSYTKAGTFTYDAHLVAFSFRFEARELTGDDVGPGDAEAVVISRGEALAIAYLEERGLTYKRIRSNAVNMADMWRDADR